MVKLTNKIKLKSYLKLRNLNLFLCRHLASNSVRLLSVVSLLENKIASFSVKHKSHRREPHLYGNDLAKMFHVIFGSSPFSFIFQYCLDSSVV